MSTHRIGRITFLVHPYCYADFVRNPTPMPEATWRAYHEHEKIVGPRWYGAIDGMSDDERRFGPRRGDVDRQRPRGCIGRPADIPYAGTIWTPLNP